MSHLIDAIDRDAVTEMVNIAIGRAAASLSELVEDELRLSVPVIDLLTPSQAAERLSHEIHGGETVAVRQNFSGLMTGHMLLIFPEKRSLDLVRSVLGEDVPLDQLTELEQEAFLEVGNIILNACLGSLANQLGLALESSLPSYVKGSSDQILDAGDSDDDELVLFLQVDFSLLRKDIHGYLAFVMDIVSARNFVEAVRSYVASRLAG